MASEDIFRFRRFAVAHGGAAMRLGTDAVLLGAWCTADPLMRRVLDAGTGCGAIALMLAQRTEPPQGTQLGAALWGGSNEGCSSFSGAVRGDPADSAAHGAVSESRGEAPPFGTRIHAVEIDPASAALAAANFAASPWAGRLAAWCGPFQRFGSGDGCARAYAVAAECGACGRPASDGRGDEAEPPGEAGSYDLVVSNPPWFEGATRSPDPRRAAARHCTSLSYGELTAGAARLLRPGGRLAAVVPFADRGRMVGEALTAGLALRREAAVGNRPGGAPIRALLEFAAGDGDRVQREEFFLQDEQGFRSERYSRLTCAFYLPQGAPPKKSAADTENEK